MSDLVTLADAKAYLRIPSADTVDDTIISGLIAAADDAIRSLTGETLSTTYDETYNGGDSEIYLRNTPVLSITSAVESWGYIDYPLTVVTSDQVPQSNVFACSLDSPISGQLTRRTAGNAVVPFTPGVANIHIVYVAGRQTVPPILNLAARELVRHWYQSALQRATNATGGEYGYDTAGMDFTRSLGVTSYNYGVPNSVVLMCAQYRKAPIIG